MYIRYHLTIHYSLGLAFIVSGTLIIEKMHSLHMIKTKQTNFISDKESDFIFILLDYLSLNVYLIQKVRLHHFYNHLDSMYESYPLEKTENLTLSLQSLYSKAIPTHIVCKEKQIYFHPMYNVQCIPPSFHLSLFIGPMGYFSEGIFF